MMDLQGTCYFLIISVCSVVKGNCRFVDQTMVIDNSLPQVKNKTISSLGDCKTLCNNYQDGTKQCWAIMYQSTSKHCNMYVSSSILQQYLSTTTVKSNNKVYSTRECFSSSTITESEPSVSGTVESTIDEYLPTNTASANQQSTDPDTTPPNDQTTTVDKPTTTTEITTDSLTTETTTDSLTTEVTETSTDSLVTETSTDSLTTEVTETSTDSLTTEVTETSTDSLRTEVTETSTDSLTTEVTETSTDSLTTEVTETSTDSLTTEVTETSREYLTTEVTETTTESLTTDVAETTTKTQSTSGKITTTIFETSPLSTLDIFPPTAASNCSFQCPCAVGNGNITREMLKARLDDLRAILKVDKKTTNAYIRQHTSAVDDRITSKAIGYIGAGFIALTILLIILVDITNLLQRLDGKRYQHNEHRVREDGNGR